MTDEQPGPEHQRGTEHQPGTEQSPTASDGPASNRRVGAVPPDPATFVDIPVLRIPVAIWARTQEHIDEVLRECALMAAQLRERPETAQDVPVRLTELVEELTDQFGGMNTDQENRLAAAAEAGLGEIDLVYRIPPEAGEATERIQVMLDDLDAYCRAGQHLLTLATPEELTRFRRWFLDEFIRQLAGAPPTPYPDYQG